MKTKDKNVAIKKWRTKTPRFFYELSVFVRGSFFKELP
jgi:hypothetical protein